MIKKEIIDLEKRWIELSKGPRRSKEAKIDKSSITAAELQDELLKDVEYQKWLKEKDKLRVALEVAYAKDQKALVEDLRSVGVNVRSVWDLVNMKSSYKLAIPILVEHLPKPYHLKTKEGIIRALTVKEARGVACRTILDEYSKAPKDNFDYRWVFGNAISVTMTSDYIDDVAAIVQDESNGESRQMFIRALVSTKSVEVKDILEQLLNDKNEVIRKEAQKALRKI